MASLPALVPAVVAKSLALSVLSLFVSACVAAPIGAATSGQPIVAASGVTTRPYMGIDTWYAYANAVDESKVVSMTNAAVATGLRAAGYRIIWLDGGWWAGDRDPAGNIVTDPARWPHGMSWLVAYIHSRGFLAGIYTDAGYAGCGPQGGSYGHYQQDIDTFARWGFDAVKVDYCGGLRTPSGMSPQEDFAAIRTAIDHNASHRPMLLNICNVDTPGGHGMWMDTWSYAPELADSWRTGPDIGWLRSVPFSNVLRNLDLDTLHPEVVSPGHFNDPDDVVPNKGMGYNEARAQVTMWVIVSAPLMLSADPAALSPAILRLVESRGVIAIDQDRLVRQGTRVRHGAAEVWVKPLADGSRAVALLNRGPAAVTIRTSARTIGLPAARRVLLEDLWRHTATVRTTRLTTTIPSHAALLWRVYAR